MSSILHNLNGKAIRPTHRPTYGSVPACQRPQGKAPQNGGFALVIALSLMAFVLLLLLSITTLTQVEIRTAGLQKDTLQAQQNALLGLKLALGDLQKLSGADQRVTASAAIFDTNASTEDIDGVEHLNWVGVWDSDPGLPHLNNRLNTNDPYYIYDARRDGSDNRFLGWLVSGNQSNINDNMPGNAISPKDEVLIFGTDRDETDPNQVRVKKMPIYTIGSATAGNYAYWVSDENAKTHINGYEPSTNGLTASNLQRSRFIINQRSALEKIGRIEDEDNQFDTLWEPGKQVELQKMVLPEDLAFLPDSDESSIQSYTPALSTSAKGLLTNTYTSGLRTDLSSLLRQPITSASLSGIPAYLEDGTHRFIKYPPAESGFPAPPPPSWEQMQSYASTTADQVTALNARKQTATQIGYYPIMTRYSMKLVPIVVEDSAGDMIDFLIEPKIALVNPYSVPLDLGNSMYVHLFLEERDRNNDLGVEITLNMHKGGAPNPWQGWPVDFLQNSALTDFTDPNGIIYNGFTFKLPDVTMKPGEVISFGVQNDEAPYTGENLMEVGAFPSGRGNSVKLQMTDLSGTPQRATPAWSNAPILGHVTAWTYVNPLISYGADLQVPNPKLESGTRQREILPFNISVGLSDTATPEEPEDFYHLAAGFESSNPNAVGRYIRGGGQPKYARSHGSKIANYITYSNMEPDLCLIIDTVLAGGFDYPLNNVENNGEPIAYGYRIDHRWLRGQNFRAPWHLPTATDHVEKAPNLLYGTATMYGMWRNTGDSALGDMQVSGNNAYWGTGFDINDGVTQTAFYDVPDPTIGLLSLGQLQHMQISQISSSAPYGIGTGVVEMKIGDTGRLYQNSHFQAATINAFLPVDQNFLANNAIWDGFFFSGLQATIQSSEIESWSHVPLNRRYEFTPDAAPSQVNAPKEAASTLVVDGSFNINSTNKEAWKAVLAGANALPFDPETGADGSALQSPISRSASPLAGSSDSNLNFLNGFRELADDKLDLLAKGIVRQIKQRGPFLSLADFVNRRLETGNTEQGLYGSLEAALRDPTPDDEDVPLNPLNTQITLDEFTASDLPIWAFKPADHINEIFEGARGDDISQWVTQGDILQRIAPFITARGDTFTIRAYGETTDPTSGKIVAEARCEATVQRVYEYVDRTNSSDQPRYIFNNSSEQFEDGNLSPTNATFGRRYKIIHLRWL